MVATLATLIQEGRSFVAKCNGCGRSRVVEAKSFCAPRETPVDELAKLMRCRDGCEAPVVTFEEAVR